MCKHCVLWHAKAWVMPLIIICLLLPFAEGCEPEPDPTPAELFLQHLTREWHPYEVRKCDTVRTAYSGFSITFSISADSTHAAKYIIDYVVVNGGKAFPGSPGLIAIDKDEDFSGNVAIDAMRGDGVAIEFIDVKQSMDAKLPELNFNTLENAQCDGTLSRGSKTGVYAFKCKGV